MKKTRRAQIQILSQRKQDLERRLKLLQGEKANLNATIDELGDKLLLLESLLNEKELKTGELAIEINELRDSSSWLSAKLESMISLNERLVGCAGVQTNDLTSGEHDDLKTISERDRSQLVEQLRELRLKRSSRMKANEMILLDVSERRRKSLMRVNQRRASGKSSSQSDDEFGLDDVEGEEQLSMSNGGPNLKQNLSDLMSEIYFMLGNFLAVLQQRRETLQVQSFAQGHQHSLVTNGGALHHHHNNQPNSNNPQEDSGLGSADEAPVGRGQQNQKSLSPSSSSVDSTKAPTDLEKWRKLIGDLKQLIEEMPCSSCQLMISERADFEQLRKLHTKVCEEIRLKNDELLKLNAQNIEQAAQLSVLQDECNLLKEDLENCDRPKEEIVNLAWKTRDEAVARKNNAEIQLAKTRIENMQISSQLMEVVQQKGELSQKLAQFEDDIHYMMQRSVRARFTWEEYAEETRRLGRGAANKSRYITSGLTSQLSNLVPSSSSATSSNSPLNGDNGQGSSSIQQLFSMTGVNLLSPTRRAAANNNNEPASNGGNSISSDSQDTNSSLQQQLRHATNATTTNILTSLRTNTNKFNLRFWQRGQQPAQRDLEAAVGIESS